MTFEARKNVSIAFVQLIHLMATFHNFVPWPAGWQQVRVMASMIYCDEKGNVGSEIQGSLDSVSVGNATMMQRHGAHMAE